MLKYLYDPYDCNWCNDGLVNTTFAVCRDQIVKNAAAYNQPPSRVMQTAKPGGNDRFNRLNTLSNSYVLYLYLLKSLTRLWLDQGFLISWWIISLDQEFWYSCKCVRSHVKEHVIDYVNQILCTLIYYIFIQKCRFGARAAYQCYRDFGV